MKRLGSFLKENPSYCKWGNERISNITGISIETVRRFKRTQEFKQMNKNYRNLHS